MQQKQSNYSNRSPQQRTETMRGLQVRRSVTPTRRTSRISTNESINIFAPTQSYKQITQSAKIPIKSKSNRYVQNSLPITQNQQSYQNHNFYKQNRNVKQSTQSFYKQQEVSNQDNNKEYVRKISTKSTNLQNDSQKTPLFQADQYLNKSSIELQGSASDIEFLNKEIYELQKQLNAEKEQNRKLMDLGKNELICIEEVEIKKVFGKKNDIQQKLQESQSIQKQNEYLNQQLKNKDLIIQQLRFDLQNQQKQGQKVVYIQETKSTNEKVTIEKERNDRYLKNIGELQQLQRNLKEQLEQKLEAEHKLNNKLDEQEKILNFYRQKSQKRFTFQSDNEQREKEDLKQQLEIMNKTVENLKKQNQNLAQKINKDKELFQLQNPDQKIEQLSKNLKSLTSVINQKDDEIEMLKNQVNFQYSQPKLEQPIVKVSAPVQENQIEKLMDKINEKSYKIDKLKQAIIDLQKEREIHQKLEESRKNDYQSYEQQYKTELDNLQVDKNNLKQQNIDIIHSFNEFKHKVEKEIQSVQKQLDQNQNSFQQSIVNFETQEINNEQYISVDNYKSQETACNNDKIINDLRNIFTKLIQQEAHHHTVIEKEEEQQIKQQLENLKTQNQFLLKFFSKTRNNILDIIKEMPEETGIKIFFDSIEKDQQFGEFLRQKLQNMLKIIEIQCLQISEAKDNQNESFSVEDMNLKPKNVHFKSQNNLQNTDLLKEKEDLEKYNNILSEKVLNSYQKIAYLESQLRTYKIKNQSENNQQLIKLTEEIQKLREERDEIQEKEMTLRKKIENKRKSMLSELNNFVKTKKQFEQSFLSELTKSPNSNQIIQIYNESYKRRQLTFKLSSMDYSIQQIHQRYLKS